MASYQNSDFVQCDDIYDGRKGPQRCRKQAIHKCDGRDGGLFNATIKCGRWFCDDHIVIMPDCIFCSCGGKPIKHCRTHM